LCAPVIRRSAAVPHAKGSVAARIQAALEQAAAGGGASTPEQTTVAALCRCAGISRNTLYRYYPEALEAIHQLRHRPDSNTTDQPSIERLRTELTSANTLVRHLVALLDHYVAAYQETRDLLAQRDRELAEERRSRGSMPAALHR
jgi:AcrR family transcriptional regulator